MVRNLKRLLAILLAFSVMMTLLSGMAAATDESASVDPYVYKYEKLPNPDPEGKPLPNAVVSSEFLYDFQWMSSETDQSMWGWWDVAYFVSLFRLERTDGIVEEEPIAAYCADFTNGTAALSLYKRLNLEDSSYFDPEIASHIRGIMVHGYWHDWTEADLSTAEATANAWLAGYVDRSGEADVLPGDAEDAVQPIDGLTADEALVATQLAIWGLANTNGYGGVSDGRHWIDFRAARVEGNTYDPEDETYIPNNIKAFYKYLLHQTAVPLDTDSVLFSNDYFVDTSIAVGSGGTANGLYDVKVHFKLQGTVDKEDDLTITAALGQQSSSMSLESLAVDGGYYTISFADVSAEDAATGVKLSLSGYQMVDDVYFYEAKAVDASARDSSQNLVGWAKGLTPVSAELEDVIPVDVGSASVQLCKVDADHDNEPLPGATFAFFTLLRRGRMSWFGIIW